MVSTVSVLTSDPAVTGWALWRRPVFVAAASILAGVATALVFVLRAGDAGESNWPANWELRSSDNGVLFQLLQDVAAGRPLEWNFSPQVYVFPELPISALAYLGAGGNVYWYYLLVAAINNALLFAALYLVVRLLDRSRDVTSHLLRATVAFLPLLILPLLGTAWLLSYHLAPTYYFGMYLVLLGAPALWLSRSWAARAALAVAIVLTAASNPLGLVFAVPALVIVGVLVWLREGFGAVRGGALALGAVLVAALLVRLLAFSGLQGTSPLAYVDVGLFIGRLDALWPYLAWLLSDPTTRVVLVTGAVAAVACFAGAVVAAVLFWRRRERKLLVAVWYGLVPVTGLAGTVVLLITHQLYLWPVLVAPLVFLLLAVPVRWGRWFVGVAILLVGVLVVVTGSFGTQDRYFGFRSVETRCLDERLPGGAEIGYATFSDARRLSLTSERGVRLIPLKSDGEQAGWLANLDYLHADVGRFFYLNDAGDERMIDNDFIVATFGEPDAVYPCDDSRYIWLYSSPEKLAAIAEHYGVR